jgi:hypothetical protein
VHRLRRLLVEGGEQARRHRDGHRHIRDREDGDRDEPGN